MTDRWRRLEALLDEALDLGPGERDAWLERQDPELREELSALLAAHDQADSFLEMPAAEAAADLVVEEAEEDLSGQVIGPYRLLGELGQGGMGTVYLARRDDVDKDVALKLLPREYSSESTVRRFLAERRVLARLEHPHIARLLDAGLTSAGLPYFAMERVDGERIDEWCRARSLDVPARLRLFTDVCRAVEHAHRNAVIHRDLKPSNVLVDRSGQVKLLDFGIAKVLEEGDAESDATGTHFLTPQYASPEQYRGEAVDTATDVYSLGVLLYGLLTGRPPFDVASKSLFEAGKLVLETDAPAPSTAADDRHRARLRGDLDSIVLEAMRKEPARRYSSVAALREDVERHLAGEPVRARGDSLGYRTGRFLRRNWIAVGAAAALLVAAAGAGVYHTRQVAEERDRAQLEAAKAGRVTDFLLDLLTATDPDVAAGEDFTATELLDRGAEEIHAQLDEEPEVKATILDTLGEVFRKRGDFDRARPLLEESLAMRREIHGEKHVDVVESLIHLSNLHADQTLWPQAAEMAQQAYDLSAEIRGADHPETVFRLHNLGIFVLRTGDLARAEEILQRSLRERRSLLGENHSGTAHAYGVVANLLRDQARYDEAADMYARAKEVTRNVYGEEHPRYASVVNNLSRLRHRQGRWQEAEEGYREALRVREIVYGKDNPLIEPSLGSLASLLTQMERYEEADSLHRVVMEITRKNFGESERLAIAYRSVGRMQLDVGDVSAAESLLVRAIEMMETAIGKEHVEWGRCAEELAQLRRRQGRPEEAAALFQASIDAHRSTLPEDHPWIAGIHIDLAGVLRELGQGEVARENLAAARRILEAEDDDDRAHRLSVAGLLTEEARLYAAEGRRAEAAAALDRVIEALEADLPPGHSRLAAIREERRALDQAG